jgi:hypothetical protein
MHLTIIKADNAVGIDGKFLTINCAALPANFHALQWDGPEGGIGGEGEAEWTGKPKLPNTVVTDLGEYYAYVEAWKAEKLRLEAEVAAQLEALRLASIAAPTISSDTV